MTLDLELKLLHTSKRRVGFVFYPHFPATYRPSSLNKLVHCVNLNSVCRDQFSFFLNWYLFADLVIIFFFFNVVL